MRESTVTSKGQTTLPRDIRAVLGLHPGDRVRYVILNGEVRLLKSRPVNDLAGLLRRRGSDPVTLATMEEVTAEAGADEGRGV